MIPVPKSMAIQNPIDECKQDEGEDLRTGVAGDGQACDQCRHRRNAWARGFSTKHPDKQKGCQEQDGVKANKQCKSAAAIRYVKNQLRQPILHSKGLSCGRKGKYVRFGNSVRIGDYLPHLQMPPEIEQGQRDAQRSKCQDKKGSCKPKMVQCDPGQARMVSNVRQSGSLECRRETDRFVIRTFRSAGAPPATAFAKSALQAIQHNANTKDSVFVKVTPARCLMLHAFCRKQTETGVHGAATYCRTPSTGIESAIIR